MKAVLLLLLSLPVFGGVLDISITNQSAAPLGDIAVDVEPVLKPAPKGKLAAVIDQVNKEFVPLLTVLQVGTAVTFPNKDNIRHSIYSFSPAKTFELKLYSGTPAKPELFDKPGKVVLGCNIHDWMVAYVWVVESPWFGKTDSEGKLHFADLPTGDYTVEVWHPYQLLQAPAQKIRIGEGKQHLSFSLTLNPPPRRDASDH